jgi:hypothetical protein
LFPHGLSDVSLKNKLQGGGAMLFNNISLGTSTGHRTNASSEKARNRRARLPSIEVLEGRSLMAVTSVTTILNNSSSQYDVYGNAPSQLDSFVSPPNVQDKDHLQQFSLTDTRSTEMTGSDRFGRTGTSSLSSSTDVNSTVVAPNGVINSGAINIDSRFASQLNRSVDDSGSTADVLPWYTGRSNYKITLVSDADGFIDINYKGHFTASVTSVEAYYVIDNVLVAGPLIERQNPWYLHGAKMDLWAGRFSDFHTGYNYAVVDQNGLLVPDPNHEDSGSVKLPIQAGVPFAITLESLYYFPFPNVGFGSAEGSMNLQWQFVSTDTDIAVTSLSWRTNGGVDVGYAVSGHSLSSASTLALYWASGTTLDTTIGGPVFSTSTERAVGQYGPIPVSAAAIGIPPAEAKYLLAVVDPKNAVSESNESNNILAIKSNLSGLAWLQAAGVSQVAEQGTYPNSKDLNKLAPSFQPKVQAFKEALEHAGATVAIVSTRRSAERAYLMHWSWMIVHGDNQPGHPAIPVDASSVPPYSGPGPGIDIRWDYGDASLSKQAAQQMIDYLDVKSYAAANSDHIRGLAIDMDISWDKPIMIKSKGVDEKILIAAEPNAKNARDNNLLIRVATTYGVYRLRSDSAGHWQATLPERRR